MFTNFLLSPLGSRDHDTALILCSCPCLGSQSPSIGGRDERSLLEVPVLSFRATSATSLLDDSKVKSLPSCSLNFLIF